MGAALLDYSERAVRSLIQAFTDYLDDDGCGNLDLPLTVSLILQGDAATPDFRQSAPQTQGGVNTVPAVVQATCYYVFLALLPEDYPINQGCFRPLTVLTRPRSLIDAVFLGAVAAGNVETSQRLVDVVLGALAQALPDLIPAASQGTMNNVAFGGLNSQGEELTYYETIAEGYGRRAGSAGSGRGPDPHDQHPKHAGGGAGAGISAACRAVRPPGRVRRRREPYGLAGGGLGQKGENKLLAEVVEEALPGKVNLTLPAGSRLILRTPGGGGWGKASGDD